MHSGLLQQPEHFHSETSGSFKVEDELVAANAAIRKLIFDSQPDAEQSCLNMKVAEEIQMLDGNPVLLTFWKAQHDFLHFKLHKMAVAALGLLPHSVVDKHFQLAKLSNSGHSVSMDHHFDQPTLDNITVIGVGGGSLPMFLQHHFPTFSITCVEIDAVVLDVARKYFNFKDNNTCDALTTNTRKSNIESIVANGLMFVDKLADVISDTSRISASKASSFQQRFIFLDVDDSTNRMDGLLCPPQAFLTHSTLQRLRLCLKPDFGIVVINLATRSSVTYELHLENIREVFDEVLLLPVCVDDAFDPEFRNAMVFGVVFDKAKYSTFMYLQQWKESRRHVCGLPELATGSKRGGPVTHPAVLQVNQYVAQIEFYIKKPVKATTKASSLFRHRESSAIKPDSFVKVKQHVL